jgi:hypothetical protein
MATNTGIKRDHRERKNGSAREQHEKRKALINATRGKQRWTSDGWVRDPQ